MGEAASFEEVVEGAISTMVHADIYLWGQPKSEPISEPRRPLEIERQFDVWKQPSGIDAQGLRPSQEFENRKVSFDGFDLANERRRLAEFGGQVSLRHPRTLPRFDERNDDRAMMG